MSDSAGETSLRSVFPVTLLVALAALAAVGPLATDTYLPAFAQMATDLKASASGIQLTMTTFLVGIAAGQLLIGISSQIVLAGVRCWCGERCWLWQLALARWWPLGW